ncbi:hypothetical protein [Verrucosispora sp. WMMD573]|uniref:hypothetical protein n=1 Tax=Verrucosispora sp. WMMD573 TaxID=3015149 RepID=UPI00248ACE50|nr:hypothetical protein [Verrucosispora sp. WMMD573]WBB57197.1 hypothetical protein O7601_14655 [Verrucosispora sp. WMMD573]
MSAFARAHVISSLLEPWEVSALGIVRTIVGGGELNMGTDIAGGVEIRPHGRGSPWLLADVNPDALPRHYDAFGLLFGVRNFAGFEPVAPGRGLPEDASPELLGLRFGDSEHGHTWVSWTELDHIDWSAQAPRVDDRIHEYRLTSEGPRLVGKASGHEHHWRAVAGEHADFKGSAYPEGTEWRAGDRLWRVERLSHSDVLRADPQLRALLDTMRDLAERYGGDNVRLIVWFDS